MAGCSNQPWIQANRLIDRNDLPVRIRKIRRYLYFAEDFNYRRTEQIIYADPRGIVFINAGWSEKSALQLITQALRYSDGEYLGVALTNYHLYNSGGLSIFKKYEIPIISSKKTLRAMKRYWSRENSQMNREFSSWRNQRFVSPDIVFNQSFHFLKGKLRIYQVLPSYTPDNCVVFFPQEKILYLGRMTGKLLEKKSVQPLKPDIAKAFVNNIKSLDFKHVLIQGKLLRRNQFFQQLDQQ